MKKVKIIFIFVLWTGKFLGADALNYWRGQYDACVEYERKYGIERLPYIARVAQVQVAETLSEEKLCIQRIVQELYRHVQATNIWDRRFYLDQALGWKILLEDLVRDRQALEDEFLLTREEKELEDVAERVALSVFLPVVYRSQYDEDTKNLVCSVLSCERNFDTSWQAEE